MSDDFISQLAERVGASFRASAVFGKPVERGGVTVIPVARVRWGFGGGSGGEGEQLGTGGGGGGTVSPIGYIEVRKTGAEFKPIRDRRLLVLGATVAMGATGLALARALARRDS